jgi:hypothetical protein
MLQLIFRFLIGGLVVSSFAALADVLKPKSFAGLFGAAPSVALATLSLTILTQGKPYAAIEARSMIVGALSFCVYAAFCSWLMVRYKTRAAPTTICALALWLVCALGAWTMVLR